MFNRLRKRDGGEKDESVKQSGLKAEGDRCNNDNGMPVHAGMGYEFHLRWLYVLVSGRCGGEGARARYDWQ